MSDKKTDVDQPIGYKSGEQHLGQSDGTGSAPQAGSHGQPESHIVGQKGREILGGTASTRVLGESVDEQLHTELPKK